IPSLILFAFVGGSFLISSIACFANKKYCSTLSIGSVVVVFGWLTVQIIMIGYVSWMQPATAITGLVMLILALALPKNNNIECCPPFDPAPWDDKIVEWVNKPFVRDRVFTIFYMPVGFGSAIRRVDKKVTKAASSMVDWLCLCEHTSKWNMDIYIAVDKEIPDADNKLLSGKFYSKVYEGNFNNTGKWCQDYAGIIKSKGLVMKKMYMWYTTCPKCAKKYGKNYVVIISELV
ncbi:MAG: hypothetical protein Q8R90_11515, partial [Bacteroidales bacterium]|nr:hypothetical protein [Bacteroidales bacterium]